MGCLCTSVPLQRDTYMTNAITFSPATGRSLSPGHGLTPIVASPFSGCTARPQQGQWCCTTEMALAQITDSQASSRYIFRKEKYSQQRTFYSTFPLDFNISFSVIQMLLCWATIFKQFALNLSTLVLSECTTFPTGNTKIRQKVISYFQCRQP